MSLASNMATLGEDLIAALKARLSNLEELHEEVEALLAQFAQERIEMSIALREMLAEDRMRRTEEVRQFLEEFQAELNQAHEIWLETLETLKKIREGKIDP